MLVLNLPNSGHGGEEFRQYFPKERKISGLLDLCRHQLPVPAAVAFDVREIRDRSGNLPEEARQAIGGLVAAVNEAGHWPLFAIRFEAKEDDRRGRPPRTLLNVGFTAVDKELRRRAGIRMHTAIHDTYRERIGPYLHGSVPVFEDPAPEVEHWVLRMCDALRASGSGPSSAILIQRMVFGCADETSGNGICCNLPGPRDPLRRFRGVFLPGQIGIPAVPGCWGPGQVPLAALRDLHPGAYETLRQTFDYLEDAFGPDRYLEFTVEGEQLFLLQHLRRQRDIVVD